MPARPHRGDHPSPPNVAGRTSGAPLRAPERLARYSCAAALALGSATAASAGGDPRGVLVVTNGDDADALRIAEHYSLSRQLPDGHLCLLSGFSADTTTIDFATYAAEVQPVVDACVADLPDPSAIHILVTTRGLPYLVALEAGYAVGFEALLQVSHTASRRDGTPLAGSPQTDVGGYYAADVENPVFIGAVPNTDDCDWTLTNPYAPWYNGSCAVLDDGDLPAAFDRHAVGPRGTWDFTESLFIVTRLDGFDTEDALDLVDRGVLSDGTFPDAPLVGMRAADDARGARDPEAERVIRALDGAGISAEWRDPFDASLSGQTLAGLLTGAAEMRDAIAGNTYVPGAIVDNLTSYGAVPNNFFCSADGTQCPENETQTSVARFVRAGATGVHGTVAEPLNNVFPNASVYLFYTFGYSLGESFLFSQRHLYWLNLVLGDPLATPYAERPVVTVAEDTVAEDGVLTVTARHPNGVATIALVVDDIEVARAAGDQLTVDARLLGQDGDTVRFYTVATASDVTVDRSGWPASPMSPAPAVAGWLWHTVSITAPEGTDDTGLPEDTAEPDEPDDPLPDATPDTASDDPSDAGSGRSKDTSGCASWSHGANGLLWVWAVLLYRRRPHPGALPRPR